MVVSRPLIRVLGVAHMGRARTHDGWLSQEHREESRLMRREGKRQNFTAWQALKRLACAACVAALAGCASTGDAAKALNPDPPSKMFADADALMTKGKFDEAAKKFEDVDREHPYSPEARRAIVMAAYAYYKDGKLPEAIASAERYTTLHPGTKEAPLAHYIIASSYFDQMGQADRDQESNRQGAGGAQNTEDALSRQPVRSAGRQPHSPVPGYSSCPGDECRALLHAAQQPGGGDQPLQDGRHRLPDDGARRGGALPLDRVLYGARHRIEKRRTPPPCWGTTSPTRAGTKNPYALLQKEGLQPNASSSSWLANIFSSAPKVQPAAAPATPPKQPEAPATPPAQKGPDPWAPVGPPPPSTLGGPLS